MDVLIVYSSEYFIDRPKYEVMTLVQQIVIAHCYATYGYIHAS